MGNSHDRGKNGSKNRKMLKFVYSFMCFRLLFILAYIFEKYTIVYAHRKLQLLMWVLTDNIII